MKNDILHQFWAVRRQLEREKAAKQHRVAQIDRALRKLEMMLRQSRKLNSQIGTLSLERSGKTAVRVTADLFA